MINNLLKGFIQNRPARVIRPDYMNRYFVASIFGITVYLHEWIDDDKDEALHDHPWRWSLGVPLCGGYTENRMTKICPIKGVSYKPRKIRPWRWNLIGHKEFHQIISTIPRSWTLFIHTNKRIKHWGFYNESHEYIHDGDVHTKMTRIEYNPGPLPKKGYLKEWWQHPDCLKGKDL